MLKMQNSTTKDSNHKTPEHSHIQSQKINHKSPPSGGGGGTKGVSTVGSGAATGTLGKRGGGGGGITREGKSQGAEETREQKFKVCMDPHGTVSKWLFCISPSFQIGNLYIAESR